jgi:hypothetical protein
VYKCSFSGRDCEIKHDETCEDGETNNLLYDSAARGDGVRVAAAAADEWRMEGSEVQC